MKSISRAILVVVVACSSVLAQDERPSIEKVKKKLEAQIKEIDGVLRVSVGGVTKDLHVVVQVETPDARKAVRTVTGEKLEGYKVHILVTPPKRPSRGESKPKSKDGKKTEVGKTQAEKGVRFPETRDNPWKAAVQDCNIIRDHLKLKRLRHKGDRGLFVKGCLLMHRQVLSGGGGHSYYYTKHWSDCPIRMGRIGEPSWADDFVQWVFRRGFGPVSRGSFLWPYELKASDRLWVVQVREDLKSRLKYIRANARWTKTPSKKPGEDWTWEVTKAKSKKKRRK